MRPGRRRAGGRRQDRSWDLQLHQPALLDDPAFRLAGPPGRPGAVPGVRRDPGPGDPAMASPGGVAQPAAHPHRAILPVLAVAGRRDPSGGLALLATGIAAWLAPALERHRGDGGAGSPWSVPILRGWCCSRPAGSSASDRGERRREEGRPLPPTDSPNVLLVVLDTVRADHLSLYGYPARRPPTSIGWRRRHPLRPGPRRGPLDPRLPREHVHRTMAT